MQKTSTTSIIAFGGGCFWCTEAVFSKIVGVSKVTSGYSGGDTSDPSYEDISGGRTGHAEVVKIEFDEKQVPLDALLEAFFTAHDPTTKDRQGPDTGTQYRSVIFYATPEQKKSITDFIKHIQPKFSSPIVTQAEKLGDFYAAEEYHQKYFENNPFDAYCNFNIPPKLAKVRKVLEARSIKFRA